MVKEKQVPDELKQPTGRVVGIIKRNWRQYCGILQKSLIKGVSLFLCTHDRTIFNWFI